MSNNNYIPLVFSAIIVSVACYSFLCEKDQIIENWWNCSGVKFTANSEVVGPDGNCVPGNNQKNLTYDTNPLVNPSFTSKQEIKGSCQTLLKQEKEDYCGSCSDNTDNSRAGFYTVPGTYDSYLPPRMNSNGLNSYVRYNLPKEEYQANVPDDPFTIANYFDKPKMKEDYLAPTSTTAAPIIAGKSIDSKNVKGLDLPKPKDMKNTGAVSKDAKDGFFVNSERLVFSLQKSPLQGRGDPIRGDLPIVPCLPNSDPNSNVWFRVAAQPQSMLNPGAMNVIGGTGNTTAQTVAQLQSNATGGYNNTFGATPFAVSSDSVVGKAMAAASAGPVNMSSQKTSLAQSGKGIPNSTVYHGAFP